MNGNNLMQRSVTQTWVCGLSYMQQTVLLTAVRGPDNMPKYGPIKSLLRWYRRCILLSALDGCVLDHPMMEGGGSFTGPSYSWRDPNTSPPWQQIMQDEIVDLVLQAVDGMPHHFYMHLIHGVEIIGYKHPVDEIREFWRECYLKFCKDLHMQPESQEQMDRRLGDNREGWLDAGNMATSA